MALFNNFPYANSEEINLDYTLKKLNELYSRGENLYAELQAWKTETDEANEAWKSDLLSDINEWQNSVTHSLEEWKNSVDSEVTNALTLLSNQITAELNQAKTDLRNEVADLASAAEASASDAAGSQSAAAQSAETAINSASAAAQSEQNIRASAEQINTNTDDIADLKSAVNRLEDDVYYYVSQYPTYTIGGLNGSTGAANGLTNHLRSPHKSLKKGDYISNADPVSYTYHLYKYDNNFTYIGRTFINGNKYTIDEDAIYRIMINRMGSASEDAFTSEEAATVANLIYFNIKKSKIDNKADISDVDDKISFPTSDPYGSVGNVLASNGDGTTIWINPVQPSTEAVETAVNAWLTAHPEATTSVADWSLTYNKLVKGTLGFVSPLMFGASGNGTDDDTQAIQDAVEFALTNNIHIVDGFGKTYAVSNSVIHDTSITGTNKGLAIHGNIIFRNCKLFVIANVVQLTSAINIYNSTTETTVVDNVEIDGNWVNQPTYTGAQDGGLHGIRIGFSAPCGNIYVKNCYIHDCYTDGICTRSVDFKVLNIDNCIINGNGRNGITDNALTSEVSNCLLDNNGVRHNPRNGYHIEPDKSIHIKSKKLLNCIITNSVNRDFQLYIPYSNEIDNFIIDKCAMSNCTWGTSNIAGTWHNIIITNSKFVSLIASFGTAANASIDRIFITDNDVDKQITISSGATPNGNAIITGNITGTGIDVKIDSAIITNNIANSGTISGTGTSIVTDNNITAE